MMDINTLRGLSTILLMVAFVSLCFWAFSSKRKKRFDEAANLPFVDDPNGDTRPKSSEKQSNE